ncbi:MAG: hypothetical protein MUE83_02895 [Tabrizicola sp.]|nr:hypothetical protein [Tabrizicola sp.]
MGVELADDSTDGAGVFRRHVLYIPGYDPFPPRRYRELYRTEGAAQAAISGYELAIKSRTGETYGWTVAARIDGRQVETEVEVLVWSDLVKGSMSRGILATYMQLVRTAWLYVSSGALKRLIRLRKGPMIAALYPAVALVVEALLALIVAALVLWLGWNLPWGLGGLLALGAGWAVLEGFRRLDSRLYVYYLMHDYAFTTTHGGAYPPALDQRLRYFGERVRAALASGVDEVLVVGHSSGVHLGVTVLADVIRAGVSRRTALSFLSLGQAVPMVSFLPGAARVRGDLAYLSTRNELTWVDVTTPGDGCSFALCDPVAVSGVAPEGQRWPLILSAAFTQTLSPERWKSLRRQYFRLHFQYLCAFDNLSGQPWDYDYFRITAGPITLRSRFRRRKSSTSRIRTPLSPFRDVA